MEEFRGVHAVLLTPFKEDESLDESTLRGHVKWLVEQGVHGVICTGSTGEVFSLTDDERKRVVEITIDEVKGRIPVLVGSGSNSTAHTIKWSQHAEKAGADGLMVVHPYYAQPNERELYEHYKAVANSVSIPIMIYNNPFTTGVDMQPDLLARLAEFETIRYTKDATDDVKRISQIKRACGDRIVVFQGCDNIAFESFLDGAEGWVSGAANIIPGRCLELYELTMKGEIEKARELWYRFLPIGDMSEIDGLFVQLLKQGSGILGRPLGKPRPPMLPLVGDDLKRLKEALELVA